MTDPVLKQGSTLYWCDKCYRGMRGDFKFAVAPFCNCHRRFMMATGTATEIDEFIMQRGIRVEQI